MSKAHTSKQIGSFTTASLFVGFDLGRLSTPPRVAGGVVGYDPYNNPPNPRTVGLVLTKRFGG